MPLIIIMTALKSIIFACLLFSCLVSAFLSPRGPATPLKVFMAKGGSAESQRVVDAYKTKARGTVSDKEIEQAFKKLVDIFKGDASSAARVATIQPDVITYITTKPGPRNPNPNRCVALLYLFVHFLVGCFHYLRFLYI